MARFRSTAVCALLGTMTLTVVLLRSSPTWAFTLLDDRTDLAPPEAAAIAARWNAAPAEQAEHTLSDRITVGVSPDILHDLGIAAEVAQHYGVDAETLGELTRQAIVDGVRTWEHGALRFEVRFDLPVVPGAPRGGNEIDIFVGEAGTFFGFTTVA
ncbi:MAG: hypothetical protein N3C12_12750 [Candidatus Binatia bacterium]|nr:hypothetical protein [Candidatus Binatia bacterium]